MRAFKLSELLLVVLVISTIFASLVGLLSAARKSARKRDCRSNLACLGTYLTMYYCKYGSRSGYPPAAGSGFLETLFRHPTPTTAVARGSEGLCSCDVLRSGTNPPLYDYREPGPGMPGRRVSDGLTQPQWPIVCDRPTNHDPTGQDDINVLFFSGSVATVAHGSPEWDMAVQYTTDPK